jgi:5-methylthioadenosine/S-adenosylhomocysteine deaminase
LTIESDPMRQRILVADRVLTLDASNAGYAPGAVAFAGGEIRYVGRTGEMPAGEVEYLREQILLPGLVNTHTHIPMWLFRGLTEDVPRGEWLAERMRPLEARVTPADLRVGALAGCLELLLNGVTTTADRYGYMDSVAPAIESSGLRAIVAYSLYDRSAAEGLRATQNLIERYGTDPRRSRITVAIGPHATDSCGPDLLKAVRTLADRERALTVIHLAQSDVEVHAVWSRDGIDCAGYLDRLGLLAPDVVVAHCTYLSPDEADRVGGRGTAVAHCPSSNAKLEARSAPIARMRAAGATVGLGTDAASCNNGMDLFAEMKIAGLLNKLSVDDPSAFSALELLRMATIDGARALGLGELVGSIEVGKRADLVAVGTSAPHLQPWHADAPNLVYAARGSDVTSVWVDGERLVRNGQPTRLDPVDVVQSAARAATHAR